MWLASGSLSWAHDQTCGARKGETKCRPAADAYQQHLQLGLHWAVQTRS